MVRNTFVATTEQKELQTDCEILWVKLELEGCKSLYIASYYRPHEGDLHSFEELQKSLEHVSQLNGDVWVLGDLNFPDISWSDEHVPSVKPGCSFPKLYEDFITTLDDCNLVQMVSKPTRGENIWDLFLTSNYTLVKKGTNRQRSGKSAIRKRFPLQKPRWEKTKLTIRHLYHETYRKPNEQLFSQ